jgi:hypothetical protein
MDAKPIDPERPLERQQSLVSVGAAKSLQDIRDNGFIPYIVGPLYVHGHVEHHVAGRFAFETERNALGTLITFEGHPIINCGENWSDKIDVIDAESYEAFKQFMFGMTLANEKTGFVAVIRIVPAPLLDPFHTLYNKLAGQRIIQPKPEIIDVFTVSTPKGFLRPQGNVTHETVSAQIKLRWDPPEEDIILYAKQIKDQMKGM